MKQIKGTTAVVTGAGGGIGRSIALELAKNGANVVAVDIEEDVAQAVAKEAEAYGVKALGVKVDVSKLKEVEALADIVYEKFGSVEILVNNAGVTLRPFRSHWDTSIEDFEWIMNVNFWGVAYGHHVFVPRMLQTPGEKHIVNTSSMASLWDIPGHSSYSASKAAVDGLSNSAREELKHFGIGVTVLHPGAVRTRINTSERLMNEEQRKEQSAVKPWSDYVEPVISKENQAKQHNPNVVDPDVPKAARGYISPKYTGKIVVDAILQNKPHLTTHPLPMESIQARFDGILNAVPVYPEE